MYDQPNLSIIKYDSQHFEEFEAASLSQFFALPQKGCVTWAHIEGDYRTEWIQTIAEQLQIHPVVVDDINDGSGRSKFEDYDAYLFLSLRVLKKCGLGNSVEDKPFFIIIMPSIVISISQGGSEVLKALYQKLRRPHSRTRKQGSDYLGIILVDLIVDRYFNLLEEMDDQLEELSAPFKEEQSDSLLTHVLELKKQAAYLRRSAWPLRETINNWINSESKLIAKTTLVHLRQVYGHTLYVIETLDTLRDILSGLTDLSISHSNQKMNEVVKVLTLFTAVFAPLNFITGMYGTNFAHLPGLSWEYSYEVMLAVMGVLSLTMFLYFRRKRWI